MPNLRNVYVDILFMLLYLLVIDWLDLPGFNTIAPYEHMNEHCTALPTAYIRTPADC